MISTDLKLYKTTHGVDGITSLGGDIDTTAEIQAPRLHNIFDQVYGSEALSGSEEYRAVAIKNTSSTTTLVNPLLYIGAQTSHGETSVAIGIESATANTAVEQLANEKTAPATISDGTLLEGVENGFPIAELAPGDYQIFFIRRTVNSGAEAMPEDLFRVGISGDYAG